MEEIRGNPPSRNAPVIIVGIHLDIYESHKRGAERREVKFTPDNIRIDSIVQFLRQEYPGVFSSHTAFSYYYYSLCALSRSLFLSRAPSLSLYLSLYLSVAVCVYLYVSLSLLSSLCLSISLVQRDIATPLLPSLFSLTPSYFQMNIVGGRIVDKTSNLGARTG